MFTSAAKSLTNTRFAIAPEWFLLNCGEFDLFYMNLISSTQLKSSHLFITARIEQHYFVLSIRARLTWTIINVTLLVKSKFASRAYAALHIVQWMNKFEWFGANDISSVYTRFEWKKGFFRRNFHGDHKHCSHISSTNTNLMTILRSGYQLIRLNIIY